MKNCKKLIVDRNYCSAITSVNWAWWNVFHPKKIDVREYFNNQLIKADVKAMCRDPVEDSIDEKFENNIVE